MKANISILNIKSKTITELVSNKSSDYISGWSPDSKSILFSSPVDNVDSYYYKNNRYFIINIDGSGLKEIAKDFDENISGLEWRKDGIYGTAYQKTLRKLYVIDPTNGRVTEVLDDPARIMGFTFSKIGNIVAFAGSDATHLTELYVANLDTKKDREDY